MANYRNESEVALDPFLAILIWDFIINSRAADVPALLFEILMAVPLFIRHQDNEKSTTRKKKGNVETPVRREVKCILEK